MNKTIDCEAIGVNAKLAYDKYSWSTMKKRLVELYQCIDANQK